MTGKQFKDATVGIFTKNDVLSKKKVLKSLPATKEEVKEFDKAFKELEEFIDKLVTFGHALEKLHVKAQVRVDAFEPDTDIRYNPETKEIEIYQIN